MTHKQYIMLLQKAVIQGQLFIFLQIKIDGLQPLTDLQVTIKTMFRQQLKIIQKHLLQIVKISPNTQIIKHALIVEQINISIFKH